MKKISNLFFWILTLQVVGFLIGMLTKQDIASWYVYLKKSPISPPSLAFPIAWTILYVTIAIAGFLLFNGKSNRHLFYAKLFFIIQLLMNWLWTPLFFTFHHISLAFYWILFILFFTFLTIFFAYEKCNTVSLILIPYFLWLIFACYLNFFILMHN